MLSFAKKRMAKFLQVPCIPLNTFLDLWNPSEKRVLPFTSQKRFSASLTVEAALVLSMFLFLAYALFLPIRWLDTQRKVQTVVEQFCEDLSQYMYVAKKLNDASEADSWMETDSWVDPKIFSSGAAGLFIRGKVKERADDVTVNVAEVPDGENHICLELTYREKIPFFSVLSEGISVHTAARRRCWVGLDGKLKAAGNGTETEAEETMVYVGAGMGRYHLNPECHYISNQYESILVSEAAARRTSGGKKVTACSVYAGDCSSGDVVYVTAQGEHYHKSMSCRAMMSYVRKVPLREVEYLGCCSYCTSKWG